MAAIPVYSRVKMAIDPELLLSKGLFPENLPPVYTTSAIWKALNAKQTVYAVSAKAAGELSLYNASKRGGQRRMFAIPHPLFVKEQGLFFQKHWADVEALFGAATGSVSRPELDKEGQRHVRITPHRDLAKIRLQRLSRFKFCLITDVARFYYSIYTHAIPWALHGKPTAKKDGDWKSTSVFGNRLDFLLRQAQAKQTIGIPVGPDASKIVAEIIMSAVDQSFIKRSGKSAPVYVRHVDDYWVGGHSQQECEKHLTNLRAALKDYELDINETKTRIISTKYVFGETWPSEFEKLIEETLGTTHVFHANKAEDHEILAMLGRIVERATEDNDEGIIRSVIRILDRKMLWENNWDILEHFLAQCAVQFPHSFDYVARVVAWRVRLKESVDLPMWTEIAQVAARQHSALGRDSETCWAIWLLKELTAKLPKELSDSVLENCSGFVLAFLAHFPKNKLASDRKLFDKLKAVVSGDPYAGAFWPLSLELTHLGVGDPAWEKADTLGPLQTLHKAKISIIDWATPPKVFVTVPSSGGDDDKPQYAIEEFGSDYEEEENEEVEENEEQTDKLESSDDHVKELSNVAAKPKKAYPWS
jgi:hypothetical protein